MASKTSHSKEFLKGLWDENPVLRMLLGLCPTLAVTNSAINGFSMGLAVIFTLVMSSSIISIARNIIPKEVRIPTFIIVIATFVTIADKMLAAYVPDISKALGPFVPLIVVNCIILGRAESFASKNNTVSSIFDGLGMGLGFAFALTLLGLIREILGAGTIFNIKFISEDSSTLLLFILPPGAFIALGYLIAIINRLKKA